MSISTFFHKPAKTACWGCLAVGLIAVLVAVGCGLHTKSSLARSITTTGSVSNISEVEANSAGTKQYSFAFHFITADGQTHLVKSITSTNPKLYEMGQEIPVIYPQDDINSAEVKSDWLIWRTTVISAAAGLLCFCFGFIFCRLSRKLKPAVQS